MELVKVYECAEGFFGYVYFVNASVKRRTGQQEKKPDNIVCSVISETYKSLQVTEITCTFVLLF